MHIYSLLIWPDLNGCIKSNVSGQQLKELQHINKSLSALGDVMEALDKKASYVPYRNSKLTRLLEDCIGGNSRTLMMVTVNPGRDSNQETLCTLQFATRARRIQRQIAQANVTSKTYEERIESLKNEIKRVQGAKARSNEELRKLGIQHKDAKDKLRKLEKKVSKQEEFPSVIKLRSTLNDLCLKYEKDEKTWTETTNKCSILQKELNLTQRQLAHVTEERKKEKKLTEKTKQQLLDAQIEAQILKNALRRMKSEANIAGVKPNIPMSPVNNKGNSIENQSSNNTTSSSIHSPRRAPMPVKKSNAITGKDNKVSDMKPPRPGAKISTGQQSPRPETKISTRRQSPGPETRISTRQQSPRPETKTSTGRQSPRPETKSSTGRQSPRPETGISTGRQSPRPETRISTGRQSPIIDKRESRRARQSASPPMNRNSGGNTTLRGRKESIENLNKNIIETTVPSLGSSKNSPGAEEVKPPLSPTKQTLTREDTSMPTSTPDENKTAQNHTNNQKLFRTNSLDRTEMAIAKHKARMLKYRSSLR